MKGKVYLVGAGPGDYKLLTLKALECVKKADIIVYDRLATNRILEDAKDGCEFIYVGKKSRYHTKTQEEINDIIAKEAKSGKIVTRLKGGDPYVFGRGGEEGEYLHEREIDFEVVPGITSAIGGLCYAGIPITHRDYASSFHVITGHLKDEGKELEWDVLAKLSGTLVFLMGVSNLENICSRLIENGKDKETPAAIINWAARSYQRVVTGNLSNLHGKAMEQKIGSPSLIVIGGVVNLRESLNFFEEKPMFGKNILVTRSRSQSSKLSEKIFDLGGNAIEFPTIEIKEITPNYELEEDINNLENYNYIAFTSENGVNIFIKKLYSMNYDFRKLAGSKIIAIGSATAAKLRDNGLIADIVPSKYIGEALVRELAPMLNKKDRILIPRAKDAREFIVTELSKHCEVKEVKIYETIKGNGNREELLELLEEGRLHYITFTSSSTVKNLVEIIGEENLNNLNKVKIISIGPITSKTIEDYGLNIYKEAKEYTINGMIDLLVK
ncbi:MAG: uroporphyrinogen-III C-methyltransferase [Clostridium sp.]